MTVAEGKTNDEVVRKKPASQSSQSLRPRPLFKRRPIARSPSETHEQRPGTLRDEDN